MSDRYITTRDIIIPAGTILARAPGRIEYSDKDGRPALATGQPAHHVQAIIAHGSDACSSWTIHIDDALEQGLIEEKRHD